VPGAFRITRGILERSVALRIVLCGPSVEIKWIDFSVMYTFSTYVPGLTRTVSWSAALSTADWIVGNVAESGETMKVRARTARTGARSVAGARMPISRSDATGGVVRDGNLRGRGEATILRRLWEP
jgi:hypothetical protein